MCKGIKGQNWAEWCSCGGLENRRQGMYKKEKRAKRFLVCGLFSFFAVMYFVFACLHAWRSLNATRIDNEYDSGGFFGWLEQKNYLADSYNIQTSNGQEEVRFEFGTEGNAYNTCRVPTFKVADDTDL